MTTRKKTANQAGASRQAPAFELTEYYEVLISFVGTAGDPLFTFSLTRSGERYTTGEICFSLYNGDEASSQMLFVNDVHIPRRSKSKTKHEERITLDFPKPFDSQINFTVAGMTRFSIEVDGSGPHSPLATFFTHDEQGAAVTSFDVSPAGSVRERIEALSQLRDIERRAEGFGQIQDRLELQNYRYIELHDKLIGDSQSLKDCLLAILEAKNAPDDVQAQRVMLGYLLAEILANPHTPSALINGVGDGTSELANSANIGPDSPELLPHSFPIILARLEQNGGA